MRKFYYLFFIASFLNAQEQISFEAEEGYTLGNINQQQNWTTTGLGNNQFTELQVITDDIAKTGERSLRVTYDPSAGFQPLPIMGAFRSLDAPLEKDDFALSYSIYLENPPSNNSSTFALECGSVVDEKLVLEIYFNYNGKILILENADTEFTVNEIGTWQTGTWYDIAVSGGENGVNYYLNGELMYSGTLLYNIDELRFVHDNYSGTAYFDDISYDYSKLNVDEMNSTEFNIYPNPVVDQLFLGNLKEDVEEMKVYDLTGKIVLNLNILNNTIDVSALADGVYVLQLKTSNGIKSKKFIKK
ncbi:T9SS type A sorting domain-containing protein [Flavobacteriaceae bacterium Ap0902]|nr:T9SS type A sorting domain-containing protein [Flavobacteriaceae bacterium Ap0902]